MTFSPLIMTLRTILQYPDPRLKTRAHEVTVFDDTLRDLVSDMAETMRHAKGVGLAAPQVNVPSRVVVIQLPEHEQPVVFINPRWTPLGTELSGLKEGCLSVPGYYDALPRFARVRVVAQHLDGSEFELTVDGLYALCVQHECDHLDGKVFIDDLSNLRKQRALSAMAKRNALLRKQAKTRS